MTNFPPIPSATVNKDVLENPSNIFINLPLITAVTSNMFNIQKSIKFFFFSSKESKDQIRNLDFDLFFE